MRHVGTLGNVDCDFIAQIVHFFPRGLRRLHRKAMRWLCQASAKSRYRNWLLSKNKVQARLAMIRAVLANRFFAVLHSSFAECSSACSDRTGFCLFCNGFAQQPHPQTAPCSIALTEEINSI